MRSKRDDLRDVRPVHTSRSHIITSPRGGRWQEIDVDVRHRHALGIQKPLEQDRMQRIDIGI